MPAKDLTGMKFGRLTVLYRNGTHVSKSGSKSALWRCVCECGKEVDVITSNLTTWNSKSCGCLNRELSIERFTTHGGRRTRLYRIYSNMLSRCYNENATSFKRYGAVGISVCDEWRHSFENFQTWALSVGYDERGGYDCTLDRIDVHGNYSPDNCRWATAKQQSNNRSNTIYLEYNGEKKSMSEWAEEIGIGYHTLYARICRLGMPVEQALTFRK